MSEVVRVERAPAVVLLAEVQPEAHRDLVEDGQCDGQPFERVETRRIEARNVACEEPAQDPASLVLDRSAGGLFGVCCELAKDFLYLVVRWGVPRQPNGVI